MEATAPNINCVGFTISVSDLADGRADSPVLHLPRVSLRQWRRLTADARPSACYTAGLAHWGVLCWANAGGGRTLGRRACSLGSRGPGPLKPIRLPNKDPQ